MEWVGSRIRVIPGRRTRVYQPRMLGVVVPLVSTVKHKLSATDNRYRIDIAVVSCPYFGIERQQGCRIYIDLRRICISPLLARKPVFGQRSI